MNCCRSNKLRLGFTIGKWVAPAAALLIIPKCPLCIAVYAVAVTGMGISVSTAANIRYGAIAASVLALAWCVCGLLGRIRRLI